MAAVSLYNDLQGNSMSPIIDTTDLPRDGAIQYYQRSALNGRTELMEAHIYSKHLNMGTRVNRGVQAHIRRWSLDGDRAAQILARRFGGSGSDSRNIFPQNSQFNLRNFSRVEETVAKVVSDRSGARFTIRLLYHTAMDMRPYELVYRITTIDGSEVIEINDLLNPDPAFSQTQID